jgi:transposase
VLVCSQPQDMRRSFDRLAEVVRQLGEDPLSGAMYVFVGRRPTRIKVLWWDGSGLCLLYKRLNRAIFRMPAAASSSDAVRIDFAALRELMAGVAQETKVRQRKQIH